MACVLGGCVGWLDGGRARRSLLYDGVLDGGQARRSIRGVVLLGYVVSGGLMLLGVFLVGFCLSGMGVVSPISGFNGFLGRSGLLFNGFKRGQTTFSAVLGLPRLTAFAIRRWFLGGFA